MEEQGAQRRHRHDVRNLPLLPDDQRRMARDTLGHEDEGIGTGVLSWIVHPAQTAGRLYVPLFASVVTISDELAAAALCRGLDDPGPHTSLSKIGFHTQDWVALALVTAGVLAAAVCALFGKEF